MRSHCRTQVEFHDLYRVGGGMCHFMETNGSEPADVRRPHAGCHTGSRRLNGWHRSRQPTRSTIDERSPTCRGCVATTPRYPCRNECCRVLPAEPPCQWMVDRHLLAGARQDERGDASGFPRTNSAPAPLGAGSICPLRGPSCVQPQEMGHIGIAHLIETLYVLSGNCPQSSHCLHPSTIQPQARVWPREFPNLTDRSRQLQQPSAWVPLIPCGRE